MANTDCNSPLRPFRYEVRQTSEGALITDKGDAIDEVVADYTGLRVRLEQEGFRVVDE